MCVLSGAETRAKEVFERAAFKSKRRGRKDSLRPKWPLPNTGSTGM